jgi:LemA protein
MGIFENYPDLKASKAFSELMKELVETENRISQSRALTNAAVNIHNTFISTIPMSWVAKILGYKMQPWFKANENALMVPDMKKLDSVNKKTKD